MKFRWLVSIYNVSLDSCPRSLLNPHSLPFPPSPPHSLPFRLPRTALLAVKKEKRGFLKKDLLRARSHYVTQTE